MRYLDSLLNRVTMYRLVLYYLLLLVLAAIALSAFGFLPYAPIDILFSSVLAVAACWITNEIFAYVWGAPATFESSLITGLILALIITPIAPAQTLASPLLLVACLVAVGSKYLLSYRKKHLFNPAAFGAVLGYYLLGTAASWWVGGNLPLLAFVVIGGLLVVRKIRRFDLVFAFGIAAIVTILLTSTVGGVLSNTEKILLHTPLFFLAFVMLTEPLTTPPTRTLRLIYGALVGVLFAPGLHIGSLYTTPELALVAGNLFSFFVSPKGRTELTFVRKEKVSSSVYDFLFTSKQPLPFRPGQYLEWTLPHANPDARGTRRYFTIASAPGESEIRLGVRIYEKPSTFKQALLNLTPGSTLHVSNLAGQFTLPKDSQEKLAFLAGGIGITPFRSMVQSLLDTQEKRDITLIYSNHHAADDAAYRDVLEKAASQLGLKTAFTTRITPGLITAEIPDYQERTFYVSGSEAMVTAMKSLLLSLGVSRLKIKTDYFPGLA